MLLFYAIFLPTFAAFLWSIAVSAINNDNFDVAIKISIIATIVLNFGFMWMEYYVGTDIELWSEIVRSIACSLFAPTVYVYVCYKFGVRYSRILPWMLSAILLLIVFSGTFIYGTEPDYYTLSSYTVIKGHWNIIVDGKLYGPYPVSNIIMLIQTIICLVRIVFLYTKMKKKRLHLSRNFYWFLTWTAGLLFAVAFIISRPHTYWNPDTIFWFMVYASFIGATGFSLLALKFTEEPALNSDNSHMMLEMPEEQLYELSKAFRDAMNDDKLFMKPDLDVKYIASELNVTPSEISYMMDFAYDMPLNTYIALLRVEEVKRQIETNPNINQDVLPMLCGFLSLDSLKKTFNEYTGMTPLQFAEQVVKEQEAGGGTKQEKK
ncbi:MAG: hypothetical protein MJZ41_08580 [Bacteroidaceae bacterium]|nr:hypothetical protein [Bacteroidaceae bacterium]